MMAFKIRTELVRGSRPKRFREGGRLHRHVRIFLDVENDESLDDVIMVEYELHPTFRERIRSSTNRTDSFETLIWTYGFFKIRARVVLRDERTIEVQGFVRWPSL
ncbi:MAG: hypothetical protein JSU63_03020 [Phycisphaerales bacterium]|nr:MAG: hypothetical protein JSU63_03020 [Phycisphaerales bacterium]